MPTIPEKILVAAASLPDGSFSAEDLIIGCWQMFPTDFGLQGYSSRFPDSNRVLTKIMGASSPLKTNGWLVKVASKKYRVTDAGRSHAAAIAVEVPHTNSERLGDISRAAAASLRRVLSTRVYAKFADGERVFSFGDACEFWNISPRSNAVQLVARVAEVETAASASIDSSSSDELTIPGGGVIHRADLRRVVALSDLLSSTFEAELAVIRSRTDERRR